MPQDDDSKPIAAIHHSSVPPSSRKQLRLTHGDKVLLPPATGKNQEAQVVLQHADKTLVRWPQDDAFEAQWYLTAELRKVEPEE